MFTVIRVLRNLLRNFIISLGSMGISHFELDQPKTSDSHENNRNYIMWWTESQEMWAQWVIRSGIGTSLYGTMVLCRNISSILRITWHFGEGRMNINLNVTHGEVKSITIWYSVIMAALTFSINMTNSIRTIWHLVVKSRNSIIWHTIWKHRDSSQFGIFGYPARPKIEELAPLPINTLGDESAGGGPPWIESPIKMIRKIWLRKSKSPPSWTWSIRWEMHVPSCPSKSYYEAVSSIWRP